MDEPGAGCRTSRLDEPVAGRARAAAECRNSAANIPLFYIVCYGARARQPLDPCHGRNRYYETINTLTNMIRVLLTFVLLIAAVALEARAQSAEAELPMYYAVERGATVYSAPDSSRPYLRLKLREPVFLLEERGDWLRVKTSDGALGYVPAGAVSNVWIRVSKATKTLFVYQGTELVRKIRADFGVNVFADKVKRGSTRDPDHWRTPEGVFYVVRKNPQSQFYKALVLNYPTAEDAERGRRENLITQAQYRDIVRAEEEMRMPPMNTALGGYIEIHGRGTGAGVNWTQGCVAIHDQEIDDLWQLAHVGTPVLIEQ